MGETKGFTQKKKHEKKNKKKKKCSSFNEPV